MRAYGLALDVKKIEALGIALPSSEEKPASGSKKLFAKAGQGEAAA
jgi:hypothetical protein